MAKKLSNRFVGEVFFCTSIFILAALFTVYFSVSAHAAVKKTSILGSGGKTVCRVDLDGDGTKEKLEIQISYDEYEAFFLMSVFWWMEKKYCPMTIWISTRLQRII